MKKQKALAVVLCAALLLGGISAGGELLGSVSSGGQSSDTQAELLADGTKSTGTDTAAEDTTKYTETIHISTEEELREIASSCTIDSYSEGKLFILDNDITLEDGDLQFATFGGTFDGGGHTISHIAQAGEKSEAALFRRIEEGGIVRNLSVTGTVNISGSESYAGGICAKNAGTISNCSFDGTLVCKYRIGGIAGENESTGIIENCTTAGSVTGNTYSAGVAGYNSGIVKNCTSSMSVNITYTDTTQSLDDLTNTLENILQTGDLNSTENISAITDTGGIAGFNEGQILFCENDGDIGYSHVGYNTGGIAGRSSGFVRGCTNTGTILGRKDVGGIIGQQQPYLAMEFSEDDLQKLDDQLGDLSDILNGVLDDTDSLSSEVSTSVSNMTGLTRDARNNIKTMTDTASDDIDSAAQDYNDAISSLDSASDSASDLSTEVSGYVDSLLNSLDNTQTALDDFINAATLSDDEKTRLKNDYNSLKSGASDINSTLDAIHSILSDTSKTAAERVEELTPYLTLLSQQAADLTSIVNDINTLLVDYGQEIESNTDAETQAAVAPALDALSSAMSSISETIQTIATASSDPASLLENLTSEDTVSTVTASISTITDSLTSVNNALVDLLSAVQASSLDESDKESLASDIEALQNSIADMISKLTDLSSILAEVESDSSALPDKISSIRSDITTILADFDTVQNGINGLGTTLEGYADRIPDYENSDLKKSVDTLTKAAQDTPDVNGSLQEILSDFDSIDFDFNGVSADVKTAGNNLYADLDSLINEVSSLNSQVSGTTSAVIDDLQAASDKVDEITDTLQEAYNNLLDGDDTEDQIEDVSADITSKELENYTDGRTTGSVNSGTIQADNNVGGIVGTIGVEYDLDPEKDIQEIGSNSASVDFLARAIVDNCRNVEEVTAKNNNAGGVAGHMDLGVLVSDSNFAAVSGSDYVGGITGYSTGTVRSCSAKCDVSGARYVGGIVGYGERVLDCTSMVNVTDSDQYVGAIAGDVADVNEDDVSGNTFVSDTLSGINGISYAGLAEPVTYDKMLEETGDSEEFGTLILTFEADDETVATVEVSYGGDVPADEIPSVPEKEGFFATWSRTDFTDITADEVVTAEYERITTLIPGDQTRANGITFLYADGQFHEDDTLHLTKLTDTVDGETERWQVEVPDDGQESHQFRYLATDSSTENTKLYLVNEDTGERTQLSTDTMGDYLTFTVEGSSFILSAETESAGSYTPVIIGAAAAAGAVLLVLLLVKKRKKKKAAAPAEAKAPKAKTTEEEKK